MAKILVVDDNDNPIGEFPKKKSGSLAFCARHNLYRQSNIITTGSQPKLAIIEQMKNYCYIDGQNLYLGTAGTDPAWHIDLYKFRIYLREKYKVEKAFYYLGYVQEGVKIEQLYENIQNAGFILVFRQHNAAMIGKKKGNVDSDIIFSIMKRLQKDQDFDKILLVSGDGDYKMLIDFLIEENKLEKILFPNKKFRSSLYKEIGAPHFAYLDDKDVQRKIALKKHK